MDGGGIQEACFPSRVQMKVEQPLLYYGKIVPVFHLYAGGNMNRRDFLGILATMLTAGTVVPAFMS